MTDLEGERRKFYHGACSSISLTALRTFSSPPLVNRHDDVLVPRSAATRMLPPLPPLPPPPPPPPPPPRGDDDKAEVFAQRSDEEEDGRVPQNIWDHSLADHHEFVTMILYIS